MINRCCNKTAIIKNQIEMYVRTASIKRLGNLNDGDISFLCSILNLPVSKYRHVNLQTLFEFKNN